MYFYLSLTTWPTMFCQISFCDSIVNLGQISQFLITFITQISRQSNPIYSLAVMYSIKVCFLPRISSQAWSEISNGEEAPCLLFLFLLQLLCFYLHECQALGERRERRNVLSLSGNAVAILCTKHLLSHGIHAECSGEPKGSLLAFP